MISGTNREEPYGSTIRPTNLSIDLAKRGIEISHFGTRDPRDSENLPSLVRRDLLSASIRKKFGMIYENYRYSPPDIIYAHQIESAKLGLLLSFLLHRPLVYDAHSSIVLEAPTYKDSPMPIRRRQFFYERMIVKFAAKIIVPSTELKSFLMQKYRLKPRKIGIVKNGVDREQFFPCPPDLRLRKSLGPWALTRTDPFVLMKADPYFAQDFSF